MVSRVYFPSFSDGEWKNRWQRIRTSMEQNKFDCLLVYGGHASHFGNDPGQANLRYVSNFIDQFQAYCVFPAKGEPTLLTTYTGHIASGREVSVIKDMRFGGQLLPERVAEVLKEKGFEKGRIGIVGVATDRKFSIPYDHHLTITKALPNAEFSICTWLMEDLRRIKSDEEIGFLKQGVERTERAYRAALESLKPGARNVDLYEAMMHESIRDGGTICFAMLGSTSMHDPQLVFPDAYISDRPIAKGDVILSEHSSCYGGYSGQMVRTAFVGAPTKEYEKLFEVGINTYDRVRAAIKPGATTADVMEASQPILDAGLTCKSPLLHGWGNFSEPPRMGVKGSGHVIEDFTFVKGQTLMVEPNPCTLDGKMGVFVGNLCVVTDKGAESLHSSIKEPIIVDF